MCIWGGRDFAEGVQTCSSAKNFGAVNALSEKQKSRSESCAIAKAGEFSKKKTFRPIFAICIFFDISSHLSGARKATGASNPQCPLHAFPVSANSAGRSPLGSHRKKQAGFRKSSAAAPALVGVAAAIALSAQVTPASAQVIPAQASVSATHGTNLRGVSDARLLSATRPVAATARTYTVRPGDSLSGIARKIYGDPDAWPVLYWANRGHIHWANDISVGQVLTVPVKPAHIPGAPSELAPAPAPVQTTQTAQPAVAEPVQTTSTYTGDGSFQECVINAESGGDSQVMNSSGHYGLYQFSASTWAEYGGDPADFGDASVAEQNQVFDTAVSDGGSSNWTAYDGC
jgi:LysM repeat protein